MTHSKHHRPLSDRIKKLVMEARPCGSRVTCFPPVLSTDEDWLILVYPSRLERIKRILEADGWRLGGSEPVDNELESGEFNSWTKGNVNLVVTAEPEFFKRFWAATTVCTFINLLRKEDRIAVFQAVLYGNQVPEHEFHEAREKRKSSLPAINNPGRIG